VNRNFYVDDGLKSVQSVDQAKLIKNTKSFVKAGNFVNRNFYVDDGLKSVQSVDQAKLIKNTKSFVKEVAFDCTNLPRTAKT